MESIFKQHDIVNEDSPTAKKMSSELGSSTENETGWDRVKSMLTIE